MSNNKMNCPICGEGQLLVCQVPDTMEYNGKTKESMLHLSECDTCGSETATKEQLRINQRIMNAFKKEVDGLLSAIEIKDIRTSLGLTIEQAGKLFGGGPVAFSKYENDALTHSQAMDAALVMAKVSKSAVLHLAKAKYPELVALIEGNSLRVHGTLLTGLWDVENRSTDGAYVIPILNTQSFSRDIAIPININGDKGANRVYS